MIMTVSDRSTCVFFASGEVCGSGIMASEAARNRVVFITDVLCSGYFDECKVNGFITHDRSRCLKTLFIVDSLWTKIMNEKLFLGNKTDIFTTPAKGASFGTKT